MQYCRSHWNIIGIKTMTLEPRWDEAPMFLGSYSLFFFLRIKDLKTEGLIVQIGQICLVWKEMFPLHEELHTSFNTHADEGFRVKVEFVLCKDQSINLGEVVHGKLQSLIVIGGQ